MAQVTRIVMPETARAGTVVEIRTLIQHEMESGYRRDNVGALIARDIIHQLVVTYVGEEVFRTTLYTGVAANPYIAFSTIAVATGDLLFTWTDDRGQTTVVKRRLVVT